MKGASIIFAFLFTAALISAQNCWEQHNMPPGTWTYNAWLCISGSNHGWIYSIGPSGHPSAGRMFKVNLDSFTYSSPYPATLTCYEQFTDVDPPSMLPPSNAVSARTRGGGVTLNSVPQGPLYSWHYVAQVTLTNGEWTPDTSTWVLAGCPPVENMNRQGSSPPQVQIGISWSGYGGRRNAAISALDYTSVGVPFVGYLDDHIDALTGRTASALKTKRARR